jgi:hypothetical protein
MRGCSIPNLKEYIISQCAYLTNNVSLGISNRSRTFFCGIYHLSFHKTFPQSLWHSGSYPKPNKSFLRYISTINCSTGRTTIVASSTFRTKTCATLKLKPVETNFKYVARVRHLLLNWAENNWRRLFQITCTFERKLSNFFLNLSPSHCPVRPSARNEDTNAARQFTQE